MDLKFIKTSDELNTEIFIGKVKPKPAKMPNQFSYTAVGVHYQDALSSTGNAQLIGVPENVGPAKLGYYQAKVEIFTPNYQPNNGYIVKKKLSTFFPNNWSKAKIQEELANAYGRRFLLYNNHYIATMTDGVDVNFFINNGIIASSYASFK